MRCCPRCNNTRWVCENHLDRPFLGERACGCGGAGAPCPACNKVDATDPDGPRCLRALKIFVRASTPSQPDHSPTPTAVPLRVSAERCPNRWRKTRIGAKAFLAALSRVWNARSQGLLSFQRSTTFGASDE